MRVLPARSLFPWTLLVAWIFTAADLPLAGAQEPPSILQQPGSQTVFPGNTVTFSVVVTGTPPFSFQWLRNGNVLVPWSQAGPALTLTNVQVSNAGQYAVMIANDAAPRGIVSSSAVLNLFGPLTLVETPENINALPGEDVRLEVVAAGNPPIFYQWQLNGVPLANETNSALDFTNLNAQDGGAFSVMVVNPEQAIMPAPALLVVKDATDPAPADAFESRPHLQGMQGILQGNSANATSVKGEPVFTGGGRTVWFEWLCPTDGIATITARGSGFDTLLGVFTGSSLSTLKLVAFDDDAGGFKTSRLEFNGKKGTSYQIMLDGFDVAGVGGPFTLTWGILSTTDVVPMFLSPPMSQAVLNGSNATFQVAAGPPGIAYQWFFEGTAINGATGRVFRVMDAGPDDVGFYSVRTKSSTGIERESGRAELQIATTSGALLHPKFQSVSQPSANGNRPGAGFISIGIGGTDSLHAPATNAGAVHLTPCNNPFSSKYRYRGLQATNTGSIHVTSAGSDVLTRLAVYLDPMSIHTTPLACDTSSALVEQPGKILFQATNGAKYMIVVEAYQSNGDLDLTSSMGIAPAIPEAPGYHWLPEGGGMVLNMPATNWVPAPACRWRLNGQDITGATGPALAITGFNEAKVGTYSVVMSNFVGVATNTVAIINLLDPPVLRASLISQTTNPALLIAVSNAVPFVLVTKTNLSPGLPWQPLVTNQQTGGTFLFTNGNLLADPIRFFGALPWPPTGP